MRLDPRLHGELIAQLNEDLRSDIVGQDEAVRTVVESLEIWAAGLNAPGRPIATLLFLGPTGVGKTRLVESIAERLLGKRTAMVRIDCGEFQQSHESARLVGAPPGYLGHRETRPMLTQEILEQCHSPKVKLSVVLFDEIEKAHESVRRLMLGILDKASLTLGDGGKVNFSQSIICMTSNLGATELAKDAQGGMGFTTRPLAIPDSTRVSEIGLRALRKRFSPEFVNRIDRTVVFRRLDRGSLARVLEIELNAVRGRLVDSPTPAILATTPAARAWLLDHGTDLRYGARELRRTIEREVVRPLAAMVSSKQIRPGKTIRIGVSRKKLVFDQV